ARPVHYIEVDDAKVFEEDEYRKIDGDPEDQKSFFGILVICPVACACAKESDQCGEDHQDHKAEPECGVEKIGSEQEKDIARGFTERKINKDGESEKDQVWKRGKTHFIFSIESRRDSTGVL